MKRKIANLGLAVLAGEKLIGDESVTRALQSIQKDDYREASAALKSGEKLSDVLRKKIKMAALLATLGQNSLDESVPNFDLMPSVAKDRVMLLGSLAFVGLELLKEDEPKEQP